MIIPVGTILTWDGSWTASLYEEVASSSEKDISQQLSQLGYVVKSINLSFLSSLALTTHRSGTIIVQVGPGMQAFTDTDVDTGEDYARQTIEFAISEATGNPPKSSNLTKISLPSAGDVSSTGVPRTTPGTQVTTTCPSGISGAIGKLLGTCQEAGISPTSSSPGLLSSISSKGTLYIGLAIFGFIAALALIGYSGALQVRHIDVTGR